MGLRKLRSLVAEVDGYLLSQEAPVYVVAAASSENAIEERGRGREGGREQRGVG